MFYNLKNPPQWLLDGLFQDDKAGSKNCPDCVSKPDQHHEDGCDVARCLNTGGQRLSCDCGVCGREVWTGLWPGVQEAYDWKLVCFDDIAGSIVFDLNEVAIRREREKNAKAER